MKKLNTQAAGVESGSAISGKALSIAKDMLKTKEGALQLLRGAGIVDQRGNTAKPYRRAS